MYGQMTAGSWIYIGTQGILQGTYETFAAVARKRFGGSLGGHDHADRRPRRHGRRAAAGGDDGRRRRDLRRGRPTRIERRLETRYLDERAADLDDGAASGSGGQASARAALDRPARQLRRGRARAAAPRRADRHRDRPDERARPARLRARRAWRSSRPRSCARSDPGDYLRRVGESMARHVRRWSASGRGRRGVRLRQLAARRGQARRRRARLRLPRLRPGLHPPAVLRGPGPVPLGGALGRPGRHRRHRRGDPRPVPATRSTRPLDAMAAEKVAFQGLPARICWLGYGERHLAGLRVQRDGRERRAARAGRDRPRPPRRRLGRLARSARPRRCSTAPTRSPTGRCSTRWSTRRRGASWVSIHHGGGVGWAARSTPARSASPTAPARGRALGRVLTDDPGMGIVRHVDAGYARGLAAAARTGVRMPMLDPAVSDRLRSPARTRSCAPPEDGLPYLRHDRAGQMTLEGGDLFLDGDASHVLGRGPLRVDARGCAVCRGSSTATRTCRSPGGAPTSTR